MTCIVGLVTKQGVWMGGDSAGVAGYHLSVRADEKVFLNSGFLFGFTNSFRMGQVLRYGFSPPKHHQGLDVYEYMVTEFIDAVRNRFRNTGYMAKDNEREEGGCFMVAYMGRLFTIYGDFQVGEECRAYSSVGCGEDIAVGALFAIHKMTGIEPAKAIRIALEAAEAGSAGVKRPFKVLFLANAPAPNQKKKRSRA